MITLTIKRQDGSTYWTEYFNSQPECDAWIAEEQTRPYWDKTYTYSSSEDVVPLVPIADLQRQLLEAHNNFIKKFIDGVGIGLLSIGIIQNKTKSMAFAAWLGQVATDLKTRQDAVIADGQEINLDFTNNNNPPNTIWEIREEVGL